MVFSAVGLAVLGVAAGLAFRWKVLLPIIILLPFAAFIFSASASYAEMAVVVICAEALLQGGYFVGLLMRFVATALMRSARAPGVIKNRPDSTATGDDRHTAPSAGGGKGS